MNYHRSCEFHRKSGSLLGGESYDLDPSLGQFPLSIERGAGSHVWDVDGNEYIDFTLGNSCQPLGYGCPQVEEAVRRRLTQGPCFGAPHPLALEVGELMTRHVPCAERVRYGISGSEACLAAVRLARAVTGRPGVVRFEGNYHGWYDTLDWDILPVPDEDGILRASINSPISAGILPEHGAHLYQLPWNDLSRLESLLANQGEGIAAVITEPIMGRGVLPLPGFLEGLRRLCDRYGVVLIFDESVTGFRVALGGAQELYRVTPDLATFANGVCGGTPGSVLAGKQELFLNWNDMGRTLAGGFDGNPLQLAAQKALIEVLAAQDGALLSRCHRLCHQLFEGIGELFRSAPFPYRCFEVPGSFLFAFMHPQAPPVIDYRSLFQTDVRRTEILRYELQARGVRIAPVGCWGVSTAVTPEDIERTLEAVELSLAALAQSESTGTGRLASPPTTATVPISRGPIEAPRSIRGKLRELADPNGHDSLSNRSRNKRFQWFESLLADWPKPLKILDLGGTADYWRLRGWLGREDYHITVVNLRPETERAPNLEFRLGDVTDLKAFADGEFDIAYSNSVIEHLRSFDRQKEMAREMERVAKAYWLQTPNYWFPLEPHFLLPGFQWLPENLRILLLRTLGCGRAGRIPSKERARAAVREIRLLRGRELRELFPAGSVWGENWLGWPKSWVVYGGFPPGSQRKVNN